MGYPLTNVFYHELSTYHKSSAVGHRVLVDAGDVDAQVVLQPAADHQPQRLPRLDA